MTRGREKIQKRMERYERFVGSARRQLRKHNHRRCTRFHSFGRATAISELAPGICVHDEAADDHINIMVYCRAEEPLADPRSFPSNVSPINDMVMPRTTRWVLFVFALTFSVNAAAQQLPDLRAQKASRVTDPRLDDQLNQLVDRVQTMPAAQAARSTPLAIRDAVPVSIRFGDAADAIEASLNQLGISAANKANGVIEAYVPVSLLTQVAALNPVTKVNAIVPPLPRATSQGVNAHLREYVAGWRANRIGREGRRHRCWLPGLAAASRQRTSCISDRPLLHRHRHVFLQRVGLRLAERSRDSRCGDDHGHRARSAALHREPIVAARSSKHRPVDDVGGRENHQSLGRLDVGRPGGRNLALQRRAAIQRRLGGQRRRDVDERRWERGSIDMDRRIY